MRIVYMGTPDFAVPTLESLIKGGHQVIAAVTQPDKPKGRGKAVLMTPVKEKALEYFTKAHEIKPGQIDTLWFLSRYDLEQGNTQNAIEKLETAAEGRFSPLNFVTRADVEAELKRIRG